ncbi:hypothetical protein Cgig2_014305 [Carnegiea gigantea]|uniref:Anaphase-promoting complex subunit 4 n=1 Tax=Carnegiea gigantea TaxID=171969 RepID=A0A9Q1JWB0_9CARY|nr:hypothetical protein Cgig2_014305 [Carnegiea gigantea]
MHKQWCDSMQTFHDKFQPLSTLIVNNGLDSSPVEEFLSLLGGARTSPPVHQFLVNSLGESGLKRVMKAVSNAGKELQLIVLDHIQPATEIIGFRMGELRGLSRWRARYGDIGLDEKLIDNATERVGMLLVQIVRFLQILSSVIQQFSNFFSWLLRCNKILMSESSDQFPQYNSELVIMFLKFLYHQDPIRLLLDQSDVDHHVHVDTDTIRRVEELTKLGGFADADCLHRTLAKEFQYMESSFKEAFNMPYETISKEIICEQLLPLFPFPSSTPSVHSNIPTSVSFYRDAASDAPPCEMSQEKLMDYIAFKIPEWSSSDVSNCICILRGFMDEVDNARKGYINLDALLLSVSEDFNCVDLSLYKWKCSVDDGARKWPSIYTYLKVHCPKLLDCGSVAGVCIAPANGMCKGSKYSSQCDAATGSKLYGVQIPLEQLEGSTDKPLESIIVISSSFEVNLSSSRGVACVFATRRRALVYILEEDEEEEEASDMD